MKLSDWMHYAYSQFCWRWRCSLMMNIWTGRWMNTPRTKKATRFILYISWYGFFVLKMQRTPSAFFFCVELLKVFFPFVFFRTCSKCTNPSIEHIKAIRFVLRSCRPIVSQLVGSSSCISIKIRRKVETQERQTTHTHRCTVNISFRPLSPFADLPQYATSRTDGRTTDETPYQRQPCKSMSYWFN